MSSDRGHITLGDLHAVLEGLWRPSSGVGKRDWSGKRESQKRSEGRNIPKALYRRMGRRSSRLFLAGRNEVINCRSVAVMMYKLVLDAANK